MTDSKWAIGTDPATKMGDVLTAVSNTSLLPHQISEWKYWDDDDDEWSIDLNLTVTGNICNGIEISVLILTISTVEGAPEYPENIYIVDKTGETGRLAGVYRRKESWGKDRVWKNSEYDELLLSDKCEYLVNSFNIISMISIMKMGSCTSH